MAGRFTRSKAAGLDLDDIFAQIAQDTGLNAAVAQMMRIEAALDRLESFLRLGRARRDLGDATFTLPVRPWVIIYDLVEGDVEVLRIVDGRRDLPTLFSRPR